MASTTAFLLFCTLFQLFIATVAHPCVFPFIYKGKSYYSCTEVDSQNHPWCATTANYDKSPQWKYCGTKVPHPCVFPFIYKGKSYYSCTEVDSQNHPWCATTANYDKSPQWKYCATKEYGGNSGGHSCVFPFKYKGCSFYSCINKDEKEGTFWCATTSNYDKDKRWSYCADTNYQNQYYDSRDDNFPVKIMIYAICHLIFTNIISLGLLPVELTRLCIT